MKDGELHITCDCHTHELHFERDDDIGTNNEIVMWYVSFWQRGYRTDTTWRWRIKCIWHILRTGRPYGDEVILSRPQMQELSDYTQQELKHKKV